MTIERVNANVPVSPATQSSNAGTPMRARTAQADEAVSPGVSTTEIGAAVTQLQNQLDTFFPKSEFRVDYLSGLDVVTVRIAGTGEVLRQIPSAQAVNLARLISDGGGQEPLALLDSTV